MSKLVLFVPHNHYDPTWRRCFDRSAVFHGVTVRSYAEIEEHGINAFLALAGAGYTFSEGQTALWRKYLQRNPDRLERIRELIRTGQIAVMLAGETVQDTNLPAAEGLIRNFLTAMPLYRQLCGEDHPGLEMAWLEDGFGNSANYPQVLRGVGARAACRTSYRTCPEEVWVGIDGTGIPCEDHVKRFGTGAFDKFPPCPACKGRGCDECNHTGLVFIPFDLASVRAELEEACQAEGEWTAVDVTTEELLPDPRFVELVAELNRQYAGKAEIRFATMLDIHQRVIADLEAKAARRDKTPTEDLNPAMSGTQVSRIAIKQVSRSAAYELLLAEARLASAAWQAGAPVAQPEGLSEAWRNVAFAQFHDAITGTHVDQANAELHDMLDEARRAARRLGELPAPSTERSETFTPMLQRQGSVRLGELDATFDRVGLLSVTRDGEDLFGQLPYTPARPAIRLGELVLESDFGDAWGQRIAPHGWPTSVMMVPLGSYHASVESAEGAIRWRGRYDGGDPKIRRLEWTVTARASADGLRIDFTAEVDWDTGSKRLRVMVPVKAQDGTATYEVPFGFIDRTFDRSKLDFSQWKANTMEWPALHWVRKAIDERRGVAVLNKGLPCGRWMPGELDISLVRSPEYGFCAVEPGHYEFWDIDGQRDAGRHTFEYSIWPYYEGLSAGELTRAGYAYNLPGDIRPPFAVEGDVVVTAWKPAEDGSGWILRLQEAGGTGTKVTLNFDKPRTVTPTDLLERPTGQGIKGKTFAADLHKHGLMTVKIR